MIKKGLTGNQLKLIAMITMTVDHVGMVFFPTQVIFRIIGRLAYPIFAWMIAEGCRYTKSRPRYLGLMASMAALYQTVYFVVAGSLYQCILVTFSLSICLIFLTGKAMETKKFTAWLAVCGGICAVFFLTEVLPATVPGTDFSVDYGFWGVMLPVLIYLGRSKWQKLCLGAAALLILASTIGDIQLFALLALPLLALYNGRRGKWKMKYFFYIYYPAHLVAIYFIDMLL